MLSMLLGTPLRTNMDVKHLYTKHCFRQTPMLMFFSKSLGLHSEIRLKHTLYRLFHAKSFRTALILYSGGMWVNQVRHFTAR